MENQFKQLDVSFYQQTDQRDKTHENSEQSLRKLPEDLGQWDKQYATGQKDHINANVSV